MDTGEKRTGERHAMEEQMGNMATLVLEDGSFFKGRAVGAQGRVFGELVFNTSMTGYQEILTDPSYRGFIVAMSYPMIGNYGVNEVDLESAQVHPRGFVVHELCREPSNWRSQGPLNDLLVRNGVVGLEGIDTRALIRHVRKQGSMKAVLATGSYDIEELLDQIKKMPDLSAERLVDEVTPDEPYLFADGDGPRVTVIDFGVKANVLRSIDDRGCRVYVVPARFNSEQIMATQPDGVILSNGPGDPNALPKVVETIKELIGRFPLFGIGLGHQLLGLALGGDTFKMKYGHRGANHPVRDQRTGRIYITSQNHGFALCDEGWSERDVVITHRNVNDQTIEGIAHKHLPVSSVQFHPEGFAEPRESNRLFDDFFNQVRTSA